jgi:hypothetical protein
MNRISLQASQSIESLNWMSEPADGSKYPAIYSTYLSALEQGDGQCENGARVA